MFRVDVSWSKIFSPTSGNMCNFHNTWFDILNWSMRSDNVTFIWITWSFMTAAYQTHVNKRSLKWIEMWSAKLTYQVPSIADYLLPHISAGACSNTTLAFTVSWYPLVLFWLNKHILILHIFPSEAVWLIIITYYIFIHYIDWIHTQLDYWFSVKYHNYCSVRY